MDALILDITWLHALTNVIWQMDNINEIWTLIDYVIQYFYFVPHHSKVSRVGRVACQRITYNGYSLYHTFNMTHIEAS